MRDAARRKNRSRTMWGLPRSAAAWLGAILLLFGVVLIIESLMLPRGSERRLPLLSLPATMGAAPNPFSVMRSSAESLSGVLVGTARPAALRAMQRPPNISVVVSCFGHSAFLEEALASLVDQKYPPAEIIIVDDGSEDACGEVAQRILAKTLAAARRRQVQLLQSWWGWTAADLGRFKDEVLKTPNRGVAHARNTGIRAARGNWICCLDGDDMVSDTYFLKAMAVVAGSPRTNLVYANQQFFGESKWQWHPPELKVDEALVNGPLPLMTLWRRDLWEATPYGFDEALPRGHEDWAFWLQLTRLPLVWHKIDEFLTHYRFKKNSKMRNRQRANPEVPRLLRTLFPDLYPVRKLLVDHHELLKPGGFSEMVQMDVSVSHHLYPERATPYLWLGMILQVKGDLHAAAAAFNRSKALSAPYDWQASFRLWRLLREQPAEIAAEARERAALLARWGSVQFGWYSTDAFGDVAGDGGSQ